MKCFVHLSHNMGAWGGVSLPLSSRVNTQKQPKKRRWRMLSSRTSKIGDGHWEHSSLDKNPVPNCESPRNGLSAETANALPGVRRSCAPCITPTRVLKKKDNHNKSKEGPPHQKKRNTFSVLIGTYVERTSGGCRIQRTKAKRKGTFTSQRYLHG